MPLRPPSGEAHPALRAWRQRQLAAEHQDALALAQKVNVTFDPNGSYELRYPQLGSLLILTYLAGYLAGANNEEEHLHPPELKL